MFRKKNNHGVNLIRSSEKCWIISGLYFLDPLLCFCVKYVDKRYIKDALQRLSQFLATESLLK